MPEILIALLEPVLAIIEDVNKKIKAYERYIETVSVEEYPETQKLREIAGVGPITALAFVLTVDDPSRFRKSRNLGPFLGLTPKRDQSGATDKQLGISKNGNKHLRRLLINAANYITGPFGPDCELKRFLEKFGTTQAGRNKARVAVARKLSVLLDKLWISDEDYDPFYNQNKRIKKVA